MLNHVMAPNIKDIAPNYVTHVKFYKITAQAHFTEEIKFRTTV